MITESGVPLFESDAIVEYSAMRSADESALLERAQKLGTAFAKIEKRKLNSEP